MRWSQSRSYWNSNKISRRLLRSASQHFVLSCATKFLVSIRILVVLLLVFIFSFLGATKISYVRLKEDLYDFEMERTRYWMWSKRNFVGGSKDQSATSYHYSWEEQAFAEDSSGLLGGCIWPPRSYSCSFCQREFRSAQALGGHMNVHRRDRARLRQSPSLQSEGNQNPCEFLDLHQYPSEVFNLVYPNPNPNPTLVPSPMVSVPNSSSCCNNNCKEHSLTLAPYQKPSFSPSEAQISNAFTVQICNIPDNEKLKGDLDSDVPKQDPVNGSNELIPGRRKLNFEASESDEGNVIGRKRARICNGGTLPLFVRQTASISDHLLLGHHLLQSKVLGRTQSVIEELDLELRLGQSPQVK